MAIKLNVQKSFEDIEIGSLTFQLDLSDDNLRKQQREARAQADEMIKLQTDIREKADNLTEAEINTMMNEVRDSVIIGIDALLEKGAGMKIYDEIGGSTVVLVDVLLQLKAEIDKKMQSVNKKQAEQYKPNRAQKRLNQKSKK